MRILMLLYFFSYTLFANYMAEQQTATLAKKLHLYGGEKAIIQWKRVFSSPRYLKKYKLDTLDKETQEQLKVYLIQHAADSDQPIVPGL